MSVEKGVQENGLGPKDRQLIAAAVRPWIAQNDFEVRRTGSID